MIAAIIESLNTLSADWAGRMVAVLWQSTLLIAGAALVAILLPRWSPQLRFWLWQIVALKLLVMPFWTLGVPLLYFPSGDPISATTEVASMDSARPTATPLPAAPSRWHVSTDGLTAPGEVARPDPISATTAPTWPCWLFLVWLAVVIGQLVRLLVQRARLRRLLRRPATADTALASLVRQLSQRIGLRHPPSALLVETDYSVFVCGLRRPVLVLPRSLLSLGRHELDQVILHELAHVKRHDLFWGWPVEIAQIVYFFYPLVRWVRYRLWLERELACDQWAMAVSGAGPREYVDALVEVITRISSPVPAVGAISAGLDGNFPLAKGDAS